MRMQSPITAQCVINPATAIYAAAGRRWQLACSGSLSFWKTDAGHGYSELHSCKRLHLHNSYSSLCNFISLGPNPYNLPPHLASPARCVAEWAWAWAHQQLSRGEAGWLWTSVRTPCPVETSLILGLEGFGSARL